MKMKPRLANTLCRAAQLKAGVFQSHACEDTVLSLAVFEDFRNRGLGFSSFCFGLRVTRIQVPISEGFPVP